LAITKEHKQELVNQYVEWLKRSQAVILADYRGQPSKSIYGLRTKVREARGELHYVKNTLLRKALKEVGMPAPDELLTGPTTVAFCFDEPPPVAKVMLKFAEESKTSVLKGGLVGNQVIDSKGVKALSELPPRPIVLAQVLGTIQAPGGKVAGVVNAGLRQIVSVIQARADQLKAAEGAAA
jgi:large subunit ribosomal protein L10